MIIYACIKDGIVQAQLTLASPVDGIGPIVPPDVMSDFDLVLVIPALIRRNVGLSATSLLFWNNGAPAWVETSPLVDLRARKVAEISQACSAQIVGGFTSSALGADHHYPAKPQDQANLIASITDSLLAGSDPTWTTPFWCADSAGVWDFRPHTIAQIQQVGREGKAATLAAMGKNEALRQQIMAATAEQLQSIQWGPNEPTP